MTQAYIEQSPELERDEEPTDPTRECPYCRRICSVREWLEQHACNDCYHPATA